MYQVVLDEENKLEIQRTVKTWNLIRSSNVFKVLNRKKIKSMSYGKPNMHNYEDATLSDPRLSERGTLENSTPYSHCLLIIAL